MALKQHHFVLVHGGGHGAWCWVKILLGLEKAGHRVTALDLVSAGESPVMADDVTSLEQYNQPLEDFFASLPDDEKVVLVGHSWGGFSIARISERYPQKVSVGVYLSTAMPPRDPNLYYKSIANEPALKPQFEWTLNFKVQGGPPTSAEVSVENLKKYFYNECSPEDVAFAVDHYRAVPFLDTTGVHLTKENYGSVPRVYVLPRYDKVILPAAARKRLALDPHDEVFEIDADHSLFFSAVETTQTILLQTAAKYDS